MSPGNYPERIIQRKIHQEIKMKKNSAFLACKSVCICIVLSVFALTGVAAPISHAASSYRMRKTATTDAIEVFAEQDLAQQVRRAGIVVVLVYLPTCSACEEVLPQYKNLTSTGPAVTYLQANFNSIPDVVTQLNITAVPTFILYKDGREIQTLSTTDMAQLQATIQGNM